MLDSQNILKSKDSELNGVARPTLSIKGVARWIFLLHILYNATNCYSMLYMLLFTSSLPRADSSLDNQPKPRPHHHRRRHLLQHCVIVAQQSQQHYAQSFPAYGCMRRTLSRAPWADSGRSAVPNAATPGSPEPPPRVRAGPACKYPGRAPAPYSSCRPANCALFVFSSNSKRAHGANDGLAAATPP